MDSATTHSDVASAPEVTPLLVPAEGLPPIIHYPSDIPEVVSKLLAGEGPIAVDAERASGYKYSQRAYLIQIRRKGSGIFLIDPIACPDLSSISNALKDCEWIIHASTQDLACLREVGISPTSLFDTELGARIAGFERVGLGALIELLLHRSLAKEHSAVDWSTRPLPEPWLNYAALDVELLVELRDEVESVLRESGKLEWAKEEFASVLAAPPSPPREEPWRRTSGLHQVKKRRALAIVKLLWIERDGIAQSRDIAPGRILPDSAIVAAALNPPTNSAGLMAIRAFHGRGAEKYLRNWWSAIERALAIPEDDLPELSKKSDGPPPLFLECSGNSSSGMASARSIALHQFRTYFSAPRPWKARSDIKPAALVGGFNAAATIALSGRIRPGAISRDCAMPSRSVQSNLTMASARRFFT